MTKPNEDETRDALEKAPTDRQDQGDIAADDAGASALAERAQKEAQDDAQEDAE